MKSIKDLIGEQEAVSQRVLLKDSFRNIESVGGADCSFSGGRVFASVVACAFPSMELLEISVHCEDEAFPYIPGFLSYREMRPVSEALKGLKAGIDILLVDGQGICHPRGIGLASHLGVIAGIPTIGVAKSRLCGDVRGNRIFLNGVQAGWLVHPEKGKPLYVSPGHMVSLGSSLRIVRACLRGHRLPEPLRLAHMHAALKKTNINQLFRNGLHI